MRSLDRPPRPKARSPITVALRLCGLLATLALAGCQPNVLDPQGQVGRGDATILIDSVAIMLAIVVPTGIAALAFAWWFRASNTRAIHLPEFEYSGRIEMITWSIPLLTIMLLGGVDLDRLARARSRQAAGGEGGAARGPGRLSRLEMAVHLPRAARRQRQSSRHSRRRPGAFYPHLRQRDERLLHPRPRQHDLHDEPHGHQPQPGRRQAWGVPRRVAPCSAGMVLPTCILTSRPSRRTSSKPGSMRRATTSARRSTRTPTRISRSRASTSRRFVYSDVDADLFHKILTQALPPGPGPESAAYPDLWLAWCGRK